MGRLIAWTAVLIAAVKLGAKALLKSNATPERDEIDLACVIGRTSFVSTADPFLGGTVLAIASMVDIDLRHAGPAPTGIEIGLRVIASRVRVVIPGGWQVISTFAPLPPAEGGDEPRLWLTGRAWLGSVEVVTAPIAATKPV
ncbi:MAG TPA: hypothetical protein VID03_10360 [Acidimicrobiia bacterium]|jgi:hypothetical protein